MSFSCLITQRYAEEGMPEEATQLKERLESYRQTLTKLGMRDYQVWLKGTIRFDI